MIYMRYFYNTSLFDYLFTCFARLSSILAVNYVVSQDCFARAPSFQDLMQSLAQKTHHCESAMLNLPN